MKGKREADNNFNFKSEKLDELRSRVDAAFDEHGDEAWEQIKGIFTHPKRLLVAALAAVLLVGVFYAPDEFNEVVVMKKFHFWLPVIEFVLVAAWTPAAAEPSLTSPRSTAWTSSTPACPCFRCTPPGKSTARPTSTRRAAATRPSCARKVRGNRGFDRLMQSMGDFRTVFSSC